MYSISDFFSFILATPLSKITLNFIDVLIQSGKYDCGHFAIAFATALVFRHNPGQFLFNQRAMRKHLWTCLKNKRMLMFPVKRERRNKQKIKAIYSASACFLLMSTPSHDRDSNDRMFEVQGLV